MSAYVAAISQLSASGQKMTKEGERERERGRGQWNCCLKHLIFSTKKDLRKEIQGWIDVLLLVIQVYLEKKFRCSMGVLIYDLKNVLSQKKLTVAQWHQSKIITCDKYPAYCLALYNTGTVFDMLFWNSDLEILNCSWKKKVSQQMMCCSH